MLSSSAKFLSDALAGSPCLPGYQVCNHTTPGSHHGSIPGCKVLIKEFVSPALCTRVCTTPAHFLSHARGKRSCASQIPVPDFPRAMSGCASKKRSILYSVRGRTASKPLEARCRSHPARYCMHDIRLSCHCMARAASRVLEAGPMVKVRLTSPGRLH